MSAHLSEEEQIEALKRWWKDNGRQTIAAVLVGVGVWWGWGAWQDNQLAKAEAASLTYMKMLEAAAVAAPVERTDEQRANVVHQAITLKEEHSGTQYARYASLMLAKLAVEQEDYDTASKELNSVLDSGADEGVKLIARFRLARVESARGNLDKSLELLQGQNAGDMSSAFAEVRGDVYLQKGDVEAARNAYEEAVTLATAADERSRELLELKLNRVSKSEPSGDKDEPSADKEEPSADKEESSTDKEESSTDEEESSAEEEPSEKEQNAQDSENTEQQ